MIDLGVVLELGEGVQIRNGSRQGVGYLGEDVQIRDGSRRGIGYLGEGCSNPRWI